MLRFSTKSLSKNTSSNKAKHLVVFGGTGWVGQNIIRKALAADWTVTSASRSGQAPHNFPDAWKVEWLKCDATNRRAVEDLFTRVTLPVDAVISTVGLLTLDRTAAIMMNGGTNTNIIAALYHRQQLVLKNEANNSKNKKDGKGEGDEDSKLAEEEEQEKKNNNNKSKKKAPASGPVNTAAVTRMPRGTPRKNDEAGAAGSDELVFADDGLPVFDLQKIAKDQKENLPALTSHKSGLPRVVYISAASFGFPFTKILRGYYDGKIQTEKAMMEHVGPRGVILRPGAIHGVRRTQSGVPIPLSPIFLPMELAFPLWHRLTGLGCLQPPSSVHAVAAAALEAAAREDISVEEEEQKKKGEFSRFHIDGGYGYRKKGGVPGYSDSKSKKLETCPIFEYNGIQYLASLWKSNQKK